MKKKIKLSKIQVVFLCILCFLIFLSQLSSSKDIIYSLGFISGFATGWVGLLLGFNFLFRTNTCKINLEGHID